MDMDLYNEAIQYEQLTKSIYHLQNEASHNIQVEHNVDVSVWCCHQAQCFMAF
ncbi:hypothetical protein [Desulfosporosinus sp. BG]|uniref:hypothetical protein n=1 Tax=Desulfosporosinus sp. BG TaxID=1633135 RepID=UPI000856CB31|nr:hypothetical protein [Desulfosporosinus sp. BG]ODA40988.1 hypothetical protein DSBG_2291 [Desulfosporosinus sp. BG]